eukprot:6816525-Prorocentrum_lima.AAC.1
MFPCASYSRRVDRASRWKCACRSRALLRSLLLGGLAPMPAPWRSSQSAMGAVVASAGRVPA